MKLYKVSEDIKLFVRIIKGCNWSTGWVGHCFEVDECVMYDEGKYKVYVTVEGSRCGIWWDEFQIISEDEFIEFNNDYTKKELVKDIKRKLRDMKMELRKEVGMNLDYELNEINCDKT